MQNTTYKTVAVILAAGVGSRMNSSTTKQKLVICGKSVLRRTLEAFESSREVEAVIVVTRQDELEFARKEASVLEKVIDFVIGGETRAESAKNGFLAAKDLCDFVMIHDAARCLITGKKIDAVATATYVHGAASASHYISDSIKIVADGFITKNVNRNELISVQTPQAFAKDLYASALAVASSLGSEVTDDNSLVELIGVNVYPVDTGKDNIKITDPEDIELAEYLISRM
jgi:2-C-methyl-D-erythritol 4-phosphate cytidylyltransferase